MPSRIAGIALDAANPALLAAFWCAVLDWEVVPEDSDDDDVVSIAARDRTGPCMDIIAVPEHKAGKNRLHLDLRADGTSTAEEVQRLLDLGATRADIGQGPDVSWVVLADPEGNEFCLLSRTMQEVLRDEERARQQVPS